MSLGSSMSHQQHQHFQQQHPLLAAAGNNYALNQPRAHLPGHVNSLRPLVSAGSSASGIYYGSSPSAPYGLSASDTDGAGGSYDYHPVHAPVSHLPTGGSYSYHATAAAAPGTDYGAPQPPPSATKTFAGLTKKKGGSSALSALTLLSFFFFVNLLQNCLKDHMNAMNPTVMVMTAGVVRNRFNKLAEMNSREQSSAAASHNAFSSGASLVVQPADLVASGGTQSLVASASTVQLQSPYSSSTDGGHARPTTTNNNNNNNNNNYNNYYNNNDANKQHNNNNHNSYNYEPDPEFYDASSYPNRTLDSVVSSDKRLQYQPQQHHEQSDGSWPYGQGSSVASATSSHRNHDSNNYGGSTWSSRLPNRVAGNNYFEDDDGDEAVVRREDSHYTRIN